MAVISPTSSKLYKLKSLRYWDVKVSPAETKEVGGHMMPTLTGGLIGKLGFAKRSRRITIETYGVDEVQKKHHRRKSSLEVGRRLSFDKFMIMGSPNDKAATTKLEQDEVVVFRVFKSKRITDTSYKIDDGEWDEQFLNALSTETNAGEESSPAKESRWTERYRIRQSHVKVLSVSEKSCRLKLGVGGKTKVRTISFRSKEDKDSFLDVTQAMKDLQKERSSRLAAAYKEKLGQSSPGRATGGKKDDTLVVSTRSESTNSETSERKLKLLSKKISPITSPIRKLGKKVKREAMFWRDGDKNVDLPDQQQQHEGDGSSRSLFFGLENSFPISTMSKGVSKLGQFIPIATVTKGASKLGQIVPTSTVTKGASKLGQLVPTATMARGASKLGQMVPIGTVSKGASMLGQLIAKPFGIGPVREDFGANATIDLLIEIVSAFNLPASATSKYDPYVRVFDGRKAIYKTKHVPKKLNPVWTLSTGCFFLLRQSVDTFFETNHLVFEVRHHDAIGVHVTIGTVNVSKNDILNGTGERLEYKISLNKKLATDDSTPSLLALRFRQATKADMEFMRTYEKNRRRNRRAVFADESFLGPKLHKNLNLLRQTRKARNGVKKYLIKPKPDPEHPETTKWMSSQEIESEVVQPSRGWIESGSGKLGKVYCEVIGCDNLPNLDFNLTGGNKTDPFVCLVYEDSIVHTDVLYNVLAPRWMPWTQRAFVFNIMHPNSQIFIGVFDFDATDPNHDVVGRATCNISNFHPGTIYTVQYNLHSTINFQKKIRGQITLRIRVEWESERAALLEGYNISTQPFHVAVVRRQFFRTVAYALTNEPSPYQLNLNTISNYITELWTYWEFTHINQFFWALILWKSHYTLYLPIPFWKPPPLYIPLRSMVAFAWGIALSRNLELFPSFVAFSVAWVLIATHDAQSRRPSVWQRPRGYFDLLGALLFNKTPRPRGIAKFHDHDRVRKFKKIEKAIKQAQEEALKFYYLEQANFESQAAETSMGTADLDISTQTSGGIIDMFMVPFIPILLPVQLWLHWFCRWFRIAKGIVLWRDSYYAFWLVTASLVTSFVFLWVPWTLVIKWALKVVVWVFLGPWMKLVDVYYYKYKERNEKTEEEIKKDLEEELKQLRNQWSGWSNYRKMMYEEAVKTKDIKEYMFGHYVMGVPRVKDEFDYDDPLPSSSAEPKDSDEGRALCNVNIVGRKHGQELFGTMIRLREKDMVEGDQQGCMQFSGENSEMDGSHRSDQSSLEGSRQEFQPGGTPKCDQNVIYENESDDESDWTDGEKIKSA